MSKPRNKLQREQDRSTVARMMLQGKTQVEISNFLEIDQSTVSRDIQAIRQEWKASSLRDFDEARGHQLAELELVKSELWQAWEESKTVQETTSVEKVGLLGEGEDSKGIASGRIKQLTRQQTKPGDISYMSGIVTAIREQSKLLGLYPQAPMPRPDSQPEQSMKDYLAYLQERNDNSTHR